MQVFGYAASAADADLAPFQFERREPHPDDVVIEVLYCGVCHSDLHIARNHGDCTSFPVVPGHEIIGRVMHVGTAVTGYQPGDHVGVGCMVDSCRTCTPCSYGHEQHCAHGTTYTYNSTDRHDGTITHGGYSNVIVAPEHFVFNVPAGLDLAAAAPLLCAGITTWEPLRKWKIGVGAKVAVVGLGGLGHMAIKLAKALGAEVSLFTRSPGKDADARALGVDRVVLSTDTVQMQAVTGHFDLIVDTVPYDHDVNPYIATVAVDGALVLVGYLGELAAPVSAGALVFGRKELAGSFIGGVADTQEMLDFCAAHGVVPDIELIPIQQINAAYERLLKSDVKYRFVIDMASLAQEGPHHG